MRFVLQMEVEKVINAPLLSKTPKLSAMDLGKELLECARDGQTPEVHLLLCRGAPCHLTDWVWVSTKIKNSLTASVDSSSN